MVAQKAVYEVPDWNDMWGFWSFDGPHLSLLRCGVGTAEPKTLRQQICMEMDLRS